MPKKIFVAMSGGVDSSVAAYLLKKEGYRITGVFMRNWSDPLANECPWKNEYQDFLKVCKVLKIPHRLEVFEKEYQEKVVSYLIDGYKQGITPNPDMLCNKEIKFKVFLDKALKSGADMIATGHYVRKSIYKNEYLLKMAIDKDKDQSYFLALLNQKQIKYSLFPIGKYTKTVIRSIAKEAQIPVYNKRDSQGICFIGKVKFSNFIKKFINAEPGKIITTKGKIIGIHQGLFNYTIGQRRGLNIGGGIPYYVVEKKVKSNQLIVGIGKNDKRLYKTHLRAKKIHWINSKLIKFPLKCKARIRYRQPLQNCIMKRSQGSFLVQFTKKQEAITSGQFIVLYKGQIMLGGGEIV